MPEDAGDRDGHNYHVRNPLKSRKPVVSKMPTEADTYRKFVVPKLQEAGWDNEQPPGWRAFWHDRQLCNL